MKISKLFHWLYAILMLLPAFAIGVTCAYAIFNKNAYQSVSNESINQETKLNYDANINAGFDYLIKYNESTSESNLIIKYSYISVNWSDYGAPTNYTYNAFGIARNSNNVNIYLYTDATWRYTMNNVWGTSLLKFQFTCRETRQLNGNDNYNIYQIDYSKQTLDNVFYYSINNVEQSPLFNWAYDSFLATPITYITGLFGIAADHISVMLMSYWLAISVIWLVFDMVMYVPLLVHRWIDKGVLE